MDAMVLNFKAYQSGALSGFFDLEVHGLTFAGCKCFRKGDSLWFQFPSIKSTDAAGEVRYTPIVTATTTTMRALQDAVRPQLRACLGATPEETRPFGGPTSMPGRKAGSSRHRTAESEDLSEYRSVPGEGIPF
jgi:hypothetical protein